VACTDCTVAVNIKVMISWGVEYYRIGTPLYLEGGGSRVSEKISIYLSNCMA